MTTRPLTRSVRSKRERNPDETRRKILDAAEREFALKGYDGARLRDIAVAAGVHHALLHHYYGDKEGVFKAVLERAITGITTQAYELLRSSHDFRELIESYIGTVVDYTAENRNLISILHFAMLDEGSPAYASCQEVFTSILLPLLETTRQVLEAAQAEGKLRSDIDARRMVAIAMGAASFIFHEHHFFDMYFGKDIRDQDMREAHKKSIVQIILTGAATPRATKAPPS